jgi:nitrite reductase/ring-hydroxylating ferredoxin subunit
MTIISVATSSQVKEGEVLPIKFESTKAMLSRVDGKVYAVENKCPHLGMPLAKGKVCNNAITCRWHGATFDLKTGENIKWVDSFLGVPLPEASHQLLSLGKQAQGLKTFKVKEENDDISILIHS